MEEKKITKTEQQALNRARLRGDVIAMIKRGDIRGRLLTRLRNRVIRRAKKGLYRADVAVVPKGYRFDRQKRCIVRAPVQRRPSMLGRILGRRAA